MSLNSCGVFFLWGCIVFNDAEVLSCFLVKLSYKCTTLDYRDQQTKASDEQITMERSGHAKPFGVFVAVTEGVYMAEVTAQYIYNSGGVWLLPKPLGHFIKSDACAEFLYLS